MPGLAPIGQITVAALLSCLIWSKSQLYSSKCKRTVVFRGDSPHGHRGPLDGVYDVVSCVQSWRPSGGGGGDVSTFDHPLETPWSFSELDKPAHPPFKPGQQRQSGSTRVVEDSPSICMKVNV